MLSIKDTESFLKDRIGATTDITEVWNIFKQFGRLPVEDEDDIELLFQCGVYDFTGEDLFYFDFVRQFTIYDEEEYSHMEQIHCEFVMKPDDELRQLHATEWYFETDGNLDNYFSHVESLKEFKLPLNSKPLQLNVYQEEI